jgi:hypothetical protein
VANPNVFDVTSRKVSVEEFSRSTMVHLSSSAYSFAVDSGSCVFDYEGRFRYRDNHWVAEKPHLSSIAKVRR